MDIEQFKPVLKVIHKTFYQNEPLDYYLNKVAQSETSRQLIYKKGYYIVKPEEDFKIEPTLYEVYLDLIKGEFIFQIGNLEVSSEVYSLTNIIKLFKSNKITLIMQPNESDVLKYLKAYRLLNPQVSIGNKADLDKIMLAIQEGKDVTGSYYQQKEDDYYYLEATSNLSETIFRTINCPSADHLAFAISGGGNIGNDSMDVNELIYNIVNRRIIELAKHFNKEVLMTVLSIETGIDDYEELINKVVNLNNP